MRERPSLGNTFAATKTMTRLLLCTAAILALTVAHAQANERWRCGPYDITIITDPDDDAAAKAGETVSRLSDQFIIRKNGRNMGYVGIRGGIMEEDDYGSGWNGGVLKGNTHRLGWFGAVTKDNKYYVNGTLRSKWGDGPTTYTEDIIGGKTGKVLTKGSTYKCKWIGKGPNPTQEYCPPEKKIAPCERGTRTEHSIGEP